MDSLNLNQLEFLIILIRNSFIRSNNFISTVVLKLSCKEENGYQENRIDYLKIKSFVCPEISWKEASVNVFTKLLGNQSCFPDPHSIRMFADKTS